MTRFVHHSDRATRALHNTATRALLALGLFSTLLAYSARSEEPSARPHPLQDEPAQESAEPSLGDLVQTLKHAVDPEARRQAICNIAALGPDASEAMPAIFAALNDEDPLVCAHAARAAWEVGNETDIAVNVLDSLLESNEPQVQALAAYGLRNIGADAELALPTLKRTLSTKHAFVRLAAAEAIACIDHLDRDAVAVLIDGLEHDNERIRMFAATALGGVDEMHSEVIVPALSSVLNDREEPVRLAAEMSLESFGVIASTDPAANAEIQTVDSETSASIVPAAAERTVSTEMAKLIDQLGSDDSSVRMSAAEALGEFGPEAASAVDALRTTLDDSDVTVRAYAARSLWKIEGESEEAVATLSAMLETTNPGVRSLGSYMLGSMGEQAQVAVPNLHRCLSDSDPLMRFHIAEAILQIDRRDEAAVAAMLDLLEDRDGQVRYLAAGGLGMLDSCHASTVAPHLNDALSDPEPWVRSAAAASLSAFGPIAASRSTESALPELQSARTNSATSPMPFEADSRVVDADEQPAAQVADTAYETVLEPEPANMPLNVAADAPLDFLPPEPKVYPAEQPVASDPDDAPFVKTEKPKIIIDLTPRDSELFEQPIVVGESSPAADEKSELPEIVPASKSTQQLPEITPGPAESRRPITPIAATTQTPSRVDHAYVHNPPAPEALSTPVDEIPNPWEIPPPPFALRGELASMQPAPLPPGGDIEQLDPIDFKQMSELTTSIAPQPVTTDETIGPEQLPDNLAGKRFDHYGSVTHVLGTSREWWTPEYCWQASAFCHRPLYFEDVNLERYGNSFCVVQPAVSAAHFFGTVPLLPYLMGHSPPHCGDCTYTLGYYRPGDPAPYRLERPPFSLSGATVQGLTVTALSIFIN